MTVLGVLTLLLAAALIALAAINWATLAAPVNVSFLLAHRPVPLGVVLLIFGAVLAAVFAVYLLRLQLRALAAARRSAAELRRQRELADEAENSRFAELRQYLQRELTALSQQQQASEQRLHQEIVAHANSLAASIGQLDERLGREHSTQPAQEP
jgi:biopolymer transport protein ExbB/TolQ